MCKVISFNKIKNNEGLNLKAPAEISTSKKKIYILIGIAAAGKTTYAKKYLNDARIISSDEVRRKITGTYKFSYSTIDSVTEAVKDEVEWALTREFDIVVDSTNLYAEHRKDFIEIAREYDCYIVAIVFKTQLSVCLNRNATRDTDRKVPENTISKMSEFNLNVNKAEGFNEVFFIEG